MTNTGWAVSLIIERDEELERRIRPIVVYLALYYPHGNWLISDLDATGQLGGELTTRINNAVPTNLTYAQLLDLLDEDGQILELTTSLISIDGERQVQIIVRDGMDVDIVGWIKYLPFEILKPNTQLDPQLYNL